MLKYISGLKNCYLLYEMECGMSVWWILYELLKRKKSYKVMQFETRNLRTVLWKGSNIWINKTILKIRGMNVTSQYFWSLKINNPVVFSISALDVMLTSIFMGGADILLELYEKKAPAVAQKCYFIKTEKSEVKYTAQRVLISFINRSHFFCNWILQMANRWFYYIG